jgi:small conductance mechanosensitive channel
VFHSFTTFTILTLGALGALDQAGVNVTVLLGGAAVLGAAIAFGSQHLIRDFFSGFMILIENQYSVGHVVSINTKSGLVEDITLRMTVLRDEEGIVHFIPHSEATIVSNMTYGWARAVFDVAVDYREDVDKVMRVLMTLAREMRSDPQYGMLIIDNPELQGVDRLSDTAVRIKFLIKTQPIQQWNVKRELLRRIKNKFDELGIAFAFPQYQIHLDSEHSELAGEQQH